MKILIDKIKKQYNDRTVLDINKIVYEKGYIHGIIGANGSGKTTMLKIIAGLEEATSGSVEYDDNQINENIYKKMTFSSHKPYLLNMSVYDNIKYPLVIRKKNRNEIKTITNNLINELDLVETKASNATKLSGGEAQKTALARAFSFNPELVLLDEPTANIDPKSVMLLEKSILKRNKENNTTFIIITHNLSQAFRICDTISFLHEGRLLYNGNKYGIKNYNNAVIKNFINMNNF